MFIDESIAGTSGHRIAAILPCYRVAAQIVDVIAAIPSFVDHIIVVDDACPDGSGDLVSARISDPRVEVLRHAANQGVGAAVVTGYRRALELGADIAVKIDGDGQMDPSLLPAFLRPIAMGVADYTKGNRFFSLGSVQGMPAARLVGNAILSFLTKISTGYWRTFDPTNGYVALHCKVIGLLPLDRLAGRYFFESEMLFRLGTLNAAVVDVPMRARYGDETSNLSIGRVVGEFARKHVQNACKRFCYNYLLRDFSVATLELLAGITLLAIGISIGFQSVATSAQTGIPTPAGTVAVAVIGVILGIQLVLAFIAYDIARTPSTAIHRTISFAL
jgi:dolichol-phosphate mannosyltransferase